MSTTRASDRFTALPDERALVETVVAFGGHGFSAELVHDPTAAPEAVLVRIPEGSSVMTNTSVTLQETGIADAIDVGDGDESARTGMSALDYATRLQEMKAIAGQPASNAWRAANVIFVVGAQKHLLETSARHLRRRRRPLRIHEALRRSRWRRSNGSAVRPRSPRGACARNEQGVT